MIISLQVKFAGLDIPDDFLKMMEGKTGCKIVNGFSGSGLASANITGSLFMDLIHSSFMVPGIETDADITTSAPLNAFAGSPFTLSLLVSRAILYFQEFSVGCLMQGLKE